MALTKITGGIVSGTSDYSVRNLSGVGATFTGNVSVGGTLTYEDVTSIESVGVITAKNNIDAQKDVLVGAGISVVGVVTATSFSGSGAPLTALNASNIGSGTVPTARLGSGTANNSVFLRGDSSWSAVTQTTINNNADNRLITGSGTANTLNGESALTFDGNIFTVTQSAANINIVSHAMGSGKGSQIKLHNDHGEAYVGQAGDTTGNLLVHNTSNTHMLFATNNTERLRITSAGALRLSDTNSPNDQNTDIWVADDVLNFNAYATNGAFIFKTGSSSTERLRIGSAGQIGLSGANYGSSGQVLTSAGSGSAVSWTTIPAQATIANNADNRVITGGSGVNLNAESGLTYNGSILNVTGDLAISTTNRIYFGNSDVAFIKGEHGGSGYLAFGANTEHMRLTRAGNVGIGTDNPQCLLDLSKDISGGVNYVDIRNHHATGGAALRVKTQGTYASPTYQAILGASDAGGTIRVGAVSNHPLLLLVNNTERLRIDTSGHMGLGVTPSAWATNGDFRGLQVGTGAALFGRGSGDEDRGGISVNYYHTGSAEKYIGNGHAARIYMADGNIHFSNASANSSGANAAMTLTERLRIDSSGRLLVGSNASPSAVTGSDSQYAYLQIEGNSYGANTPGYLVLANAAGISEGTPIGRIMFTGTGAEEYARIEGEGDGATGSNDYPGRLSFYTTADGASSVTERLRIKSTGDAQIFVDGANGASSQQGVLRFYRTNYSNDMKDSRIVFDTSSGTNNTDNATYCAAIAGKRTASGNGSSELRFFTCKNENSYAVAESLRINESGLVHPFIGKGNIQGTYVYRQTNQSANYEHKIRGPRGGLLETEMASNSVAYIKVQCTGTGTNTCYCYYSWSQDGENAGATLTHIHGNSGSSSNNPWMVLDGQHPCWKTAHSGVYHYVVRVEITGGTSNITYPDQGTYTTN